MTPTTIEAPAAGRLVTKLCWFVGIWAASVVVLAIVAYALHKIILG
jgi:Protein of unknown function (DUF2474)